MMGEAGEDVVVDRQGTQDGRFGEEGAAAQHPGAAAGLLCTLGERLSTPSGCSWV